MMLTSSIINVPVVIIVVIIIWIFFLIFSLSAELHRILCVTVTETPDVVLERPLVLKIRTADAEPELAAVLLVRPPVSPHRKRLAAFPAPEGLCAMLPLVMRLKSPEVLERPRPRVIYVVPTALGAAVARKTEYGR